MLGFTNDYKATPSFSYDKLGKHSPTGRSNSMNGTMMNTTKGTNRNKPDIVCTS